MVDEELKAVRWVRSSQKDLRTFPPEVRLDVGYALYAAQKGETDSTAKPLKGFGGHAVMEIVDYTWCIDACKTGSLACSTADR